MQANKIITILKDKWPNLKDIWLMDKNFYIPKEDELSSVLLKIADIRKEIETLGIISNDSYSSDSFDCDNFSLLLQADVSKYSRLVHESEYSWMFGTILLRKFDGFTVNHTVNICMTEDRICLIEPQNMTMREASKSKDDPYFIEVR